MSAFLLGAGAVAPSVAQEKAPAKPLAVAPKPPPTTKGAVTKENGAKEKSAAPQATPAQSVPNGAALNILIRRTLLTVNDANLSGNYSVLRDLAAPGFKEANDAQKLAGIFANLRNSKIDFAPIVYFDPKLVRQPEITKEGRLRLTGFMPTKPQQVNFDMLFENVAGVWRLYGIAVSTAAATAPAPQASSAAPAAKPPQAAPPAKK